MWLRDAAALTRRVCTVQLDSQPIVPAPSVSGCNSYGVAARDPTERKGLGRGKSRPTCTWMLLSLISRCDGRRVDVLASNGSVAIASTAHGSRTCLLQDGTDYDTWIKFSANWGEYTSGRPYLAPWTYLVTGPCHAAQASSQPRPCLCRSRGAMIDIIWIITSYRFCLLGSTDYGLCLICSGRGRG